MATSLLTLLDDIAAVLDDVSVMTKVAAKKTAGVLGDDLALNAEQVTGVRPARELPVIWAVAKGAVLNKAILVPAALAISYLLPWLITPLLMLGGGFLCYEGFHKVWHKLFHKEQERTEKAEHVKRVSLSQGDLVEREKKKVKGAIRTDFILSAEIIVIAMGTATEASLPVQLGVLTAISLAMVVLVYGLVAIIVKIDDAGLALVEKGGSAVALGNLLLKGAPILMKLLGVVGTAAMFLVGGGIIVHGIGPLHHLVEGLTSMGGIVGGLLGTLLNGIVGVIAGAIINVVVGAVARVLPGKNKQGEGAH